MAYQETLREPAVLSGLTDDLRERLVNGAPIRELAAGEWLMRKGEPADSLYVVRSGRLEVVDEGPPLRTVGALRRGEVLGELALLKGGTRTASVRAQRDSEVLEVGRDRFEELVREAPSYALGLLRTVVAQLAVSRAPVNAAARPRTISVVALDDGARAREIATQLSTSLAGHGSVTLLSERDDDADGDWGPLLDRLERDHDRVVLVGTGGAADPWTRFCLHDADRVVAVTSGAPAPAWLQRAAVLAGCELVVTGPRVEPAVIAALQPREVQVVDGSDAQRHGMEVTARRLAGRAIGIVLSGGGARAFAHIGVLQELRAAGVTIDRIGAVSLGAIVGAATAMGFSQQGMEESFERSFVDANPSNDYTLPAYSLIRGGKTRRMLADAFGDARIENLAIRFFCLSCDLVARRPYVHRSGLVSEAVYTSLAIPGLFPPVATEDGRLLVDGGVLDNLPVETMARSGEGPIIAVDVTGRMDRRRTGTRPGLDRLGRSLRATLTGSEAEIPRLGETMLRTLTVGSIDTVEAARAHADLVIAPDVDGTGLLEWGQLHATLHAGRVAAREALANWPVVLAP